MHSLISSHTFTVSAALLFLLAFPAALDAQPRVWRVTTVSPFPRGLEVVDGDLYVLSRGRVRGAGGVSAEIADRAGTIFKVDPDIAQPADEDSVSDAVRSNGTVFAEPTEPPFFLWDKTADPPWMDRFTDRPYCGLRWHEPSKNFYICAFSGVDKPRTSGKRTFSKNLTDGILRYDTRTNKWHEVERHEHQAGGIYPHHDPEYNAPPHGWLNGPDNLLPVENSLYAVAKDNSILVRYDLGDVVSNPDAPPAPSKFVMQGPVHTANAGHVDLLGHSALAARDGWLYVATRTSSHIIRLRLTNHGLPYQPLEIELLALFDPWEPVDPKPANLTDMAFDRQGRLYVVSAKPSRVYRFTPNPEEIYDARDGQKEPWRDFAALTGNPSMKSENIFIDDQDLLYITSGDGYGFQYGAEGTVYRTAIED